MAMLVITRGYCSLSAEKCWTSPQPQDVPEVLSWLQPRLPELAERLTQNQAEGRAELSAKNKG